MTVGTSALNIGIDATTWWNRRGFGRYTRLLLTAMFEQPSGHRFTLFVDQPPVDAMKRRNVEIVSVGASRTVTESAVADSRRNVRDLLAFRRSAMQSSLDVLYFPAVYSWFPSGRRIPTVVTFHDAIAEHFPDLVHPRLQNRIMWNAKVWAAKRSAAAVTTVSEAARQELTQYLRIPSDRIQVVHEAAGPSFKRIESASATLNIRERLGLPLDRRLILYVGGMAPHKNLAGLIRGYGLARSNSALNDVDLVLAGDLNGDGFHSNGQDLLALVAAAPELRGRVHFPGFVRDEDLPGLYSDALAVAMPAFSEGFGLPAAEAIACGTPVLATAGGAVAEFVGDAGLYFDPRDDAAIAGTLSTIASDSGLEKDLRHKCRAQAEALSWDRAASEMIRILERVARRR